MKRIEELPHHPPISSPEVELSYDEKTTGKYEDMGKVIWNSTNLDPEIVDYAPYPMKRILWLGRLRTDLEELMNKK